MKRLPLGYTKRSILIQGVLNGGDKDNRMAPLGDTNSGLSIHGVLMNGGSFNTGLTICVFLWVGLHVISPKGLFYIYNVRGCKAICSSMKAFAAI